MTPLTILTLGFLLGLRHATDPDHVIAVTTIVSRQRKLRHAAMVGMSWGIGHTVMIVVVGIAIILFRIVIPDTIQRGFELIVAGALIVLGVLNLSGVMRKLMERIGNRHAHIHTHGMPHTHVHDHPPTTHEAMGAAHEQIGEFVGQFGIVHLIRPLIVGLIHGLAGSAAVALLILGSISDRTVAVIYLAIFGIGTIVGMMLITTALGIPIMAGNKKFSRFHRVVTGVSGFISIAYGIYYGYSIIRAPIVAN